VTTEKSTKLVFTQFSRLVKTTGNGICRHFLATGWSLVIDFRSWNASGEEQGVWMSWRVEAFFVIDTQIDKFDQLKVFEITTHKHETSR
jgi:hypothetical protein